MNTMRDDDIVQPVLFIWFNKFIANVSMNVNRGLVEH